MLDPRVRTALLEYQQGKRSLEATAQLLADVRRETGCLELHAAPSAGAAERALMARFAQLIVERGSDGPSVSAPVV
jgi:hypothetical protein